MKGTGRYSQWIHSGDWASDDKAAIPTLPANVRELVVLATDPEVAGWRIAAVVGQDPVLAAQVMRMANTVGVTPGRAVATIEDAVRRLGTHSVRNLLLAGCLSKQMADPRIYGPRGRQIVEHSVGTAFLASKLSERRDISGEMFLAGLLHDIGKLLVLKLAFEYQQDTGERVAEDEVDEICRTRHAQMGGWLARHWSVPHEIADCIVWHHDPEWAPEDSPVPFVYAANRLAHRYGFGGYELDESNLLDDISMLDAGVTAERLKLIDLSVPSVADNTKRLLLAA